VRCDEVAALLPMLVDGSAPPNIAVENHVESCLRCQAELARYRRLLRTLQQLRVRYIEPTPGLLGETLALLEEAAERRAVRSILSGKRLAYAGAIGGTAVATAATAALLIARSRRRGGPGLKLAS
jgi:anti-sigma factor RsiW